MGEDDTLGNLIKQDYPGLDGKYSQDDVLEFQRYVLLEEIKNRIIKMEKDSFEQGYPITKPKK